MIRRALAADASAIARLMAEQWDDEAQYTEDLVKGAPEVWTVAITQRQVVGALHEAWFGAWDSIAGFSGRDPDDGTAKSVSYIIVAESHRNRGIGSDLLEAWIGSLPIDIEYVFTSPEPGENEEARRRFFARHGFRLHETGPAMRGMEPWLMGRSLPR